VIAEVILGLGVSLVTWEANKALLEQFFVKGGWLLEVAVIALVVFVINFLLCIGLKRIAKRTKDTGHAVSHSFVEALSLPLRIFIWVLAATALIDIIFFQLKLIYMDLYHEEILNFSLDMNLVRKLALILFFAWFLLRWRNLGEHEIVHRLTRGEIVLEKTQLDMISKLITAAVILITVLMMLNTLGIDIVALLAVGGLGGIAIGFAGKDVFANFFGGFMLYVTRPFVIGDWISSPEKNLEGHVETIGWYLTQIRSLDKRPIYVPNATFSTVVVVNHSRMSHRRLYMTIGLRYEDLGVIDQVVTDIHKHLKTHPDIDHREAIIVAFNNYNAYTLDILISAFTNKVGWAEFLTAQQHILLEIGSMVHRHGADFAFPTTTLELPPIQIAQQK
jgi:MscS family membrane protein